MEITTPLSDEELASIAAIEKSNKQAEISRKAMEQFAAANKARLEKKKRKKLPSTVTSETDPRHGPQGVTVEDTSIRGFDIHRPKSRDSVQKPGAGTADLSLGNARPQNPKKIENLD